MSSQMTFQIPLQMNSQMPTPNSDIEEFLSLWDTSETPVGALETASTMWMMPSPPGAAFHQVADLHADISPEFNGSMTPEQMMPQFTDVTGVPCSSIWSPAPPMTSSSWSPAAPVSSPGSEGRLTPYSPAVQETEEERGRRRRARNREAAARCRQKKRVQEEELEERAGRLEEEGRLLGEEVVRLGEEKRHLVSLLSLHRQLFLSRQGAYGQGAYGQGVAQGQGTSRQGRAG